MDRDSEPAQKRQQLALGHIRAAKDAIAKVEPQTPQPAPADRAPTRPSRAVSVPSPRAPDVRDHVRPSEKSTPAERTELQRLADAVEALTTKYEMEQAAHRQTQQALIDEQQQHIATLKQLVEQLTERH